MLLVNVNYVYWWLLAANETYIRSGLHDNESTHDTHLQCR